MLGVNIHVNGTVIFSCTAVNRGVKREDGKVRYETDTGTFLYHDPEDWARCFWIRSRSSSER